MENNNDTQENDTKTSKKPKKKFKINKNIDTYRTDETPTVSARLTQIKNNISGFFNKFSRPEDEEIENPVYRFKIDKES